MKKVEITKRKNYITLPPAGVYVAEIKNVRIVDADGVKRKHDMLEIMLDITDGEYAGRYMEEYADRKERFGDSVGYKGIFRLTCPDNTTEAWEEKRFSNNIACVQESNEGFAFDSDKDVKQLIGKKVGINVRNYFSTYNGKDRETTEIAQFEAVKDVLSGEVKPLKDRDKRENTSSAPASTSGENFTDVSKTVDVPW